MKKAHTSDRTLHAHIDGASRGNPGESGVGILLRDTGGKTIFSASGYLGTCTNNEAEYNSLLVCLKKIKAILTSGPAKRDEQPAFERVVIYSDSELLVNQMRGSYKVKDARLKKLFQKAARFMVSLPVRVEFHHVAREDNRDADMLANYGIDSRIKLRM